MTDLYAVLGVSRDADLATIRRAFRKKVRGAHPDGGGSVDVFNELKTAYDVLSDPIRRARYDESGEVGDPAADPHRAKIIEILSAALDVTLVKLGKVRNARIDSSILAHISHTLLEKRAEWSAQRTHFEKAIGDARLLKDRFRVKEGENLMETVVEGRITACQKRIELLADRIGLIDEAVEIVRETRFESPLEITNDHDHQTELTDDQKRIFSLLDRSSLIGFN